MTRWKASGIHLSISLIIGFIAFCLLYFVYYPQPYFEPAGAGQLTLIVLAVDIVIGPMLTLAVYKQGKWGMRFDLAVIATLQLGALLYGAWVMWTSRPVFIVAVVDRLELVFANDIAPEAYKDAELTQFASAPRWGPRFVLARKTLPGAEKNQMIDSIMSGKDVHQMPKFFVELNHPDIQAFIDESKKIDALPVIAQREVATYMLQHRISDPLIFPMMGRFDDYTVLMDRKSLAVVGVLRVTSWN